MNKTLIAITLASTLAMGSAFADPAPSAGGPQPMDQPSNLGVGQGMNTPSDVTQTTQEQLKQAADNARQAADDAANRAMGHTNGNTATGTNGNSGMSNGATGNGANGNGSMNGSTGTNGSTGSNGMNGSNGTNGSSNGY